MPATVTLCQRNGPIPGFVTENIPNISWKAVDDVTTPYYYYTAVLALGTNSYTIYNYLKFTGAFTTIANVTVTHNCGDMPAGVNLYSNSSPADDSQTVDYAQPSRSFSYSLTPHIMSQVGSSINLLVGSAPFGMDGAGYQGKGTSAANIGQPVYSTYFVTQLQISGNAQTGDLANTSLQISYDEI